MLMKYSNNALNVLTLMRFYKGVGRAWIIKHLGGIEDDEKIVNLLNKKVKTTKTTVKEFENFKKKLKDELIHQLSNYSDGIIAYGDKEFPQCRGTVKDGERPVFLVYKGDLKLLNFENKNISIIGLLEPTKNIIEREKIIVDQFVRCGAAILSGLARGCDKVAHQQTLDSNGKTIAVLPNTLSNILPSQNKDLADNIVKKGGLLITEYIENPENKMQLYKRYIERDRLQALFCDTIVLVASYDKDSKAHCGEKVSNKKLDSGSRYAMNYAKDYNIPRVVLYDENEDKTNPMFDLNRNLIKQDPDVKIITKKNYVDVIGGIMSDIQKNKYRFCTQQVLFTNTL